MKELKALLCIVVLVQVVKAADVRPLGYLSTEGASPITAQLSAVMRQDIPAGLVLLHQVDQQVVSGLDRFIAEHLATMRAAFTKTMEVGGRCFLVGSGTSGRISIDLAAKALSPSVIGIIAGGDAALIRAREFFEDSEARGAEVLAGYNLTPRDMVILLSASGSALFNVGVGTYACSRGATVFYFYNSEKVPKETHVLFTEHGVIPVLVDIGPQAIAGSTRLQVATLAELCLGLVITESDPGQLREAFVAGNRRLPECFPAAAEIICHQVATIQGQGLVTLVAEHGNALRAALFDATELSPTFCLYPMRRLDEDGSPAQVQACVVSQDDEDTAWQALLGRALNPEDRLSAAQYAIGAKALPGRLGPRSMVVGVALDSPGILISALQKARDCGATTALIMLGSAADGDGCCLRACADTVLFVDRVEGDGAGLVATALLKQVLNMISNATMVLIGRVDGNEMIAVRPSNKKLEDRLARLALNCFARRNIPASVSLESVRKAVREICLTRCFEKALPLHIAVVMLLCGVECDEAVRLLVERNHDMDSFFKGE